MGRLEVRTESGQRWTKIPINPRTGRNASVSNPATWATLDVAVASVERHGLAGVGIVLTADDNLVGIDLDHCITDAGSLSPLAAEILSYAETYAEISPSGEGIRLFARGKDVSVLKEEEAGIEVYTTGRYLTVTGNKLEDAPNEIQGAPQTSGPPEGRCRGGAKRPGTEATEGHERPPRPRRLLLERKRCRAGKAR